MLAGVIVSGAVALVGLGVDGLLVGIAMTREERILELLRMTGESGVLVADMAIALKLTQNGCYVALSALYRVSKVRKEKVCGRKCLWFASIDPQTEVIRNLAWATNLLAATRLPREERYDRGAVELA